MLVNCIQKPSISFTHSLIFLVCAQVNFYLLEKIQNQLYILDGPGSGELRLGSKNPGLPGALTTTKLAKAVFFQHTQGTRASPFYMHFYHGRHILIGTASLRHGYYPFLFLLEGLLVAWELSDRISCSVIHKMEIWHYMPVTFTSMAAQAAKSHMPHTSDPAKARKRKCEREIRKPGPEKFSGADRLQHLKHTITVARIKSSYSYDALGKCNFFSNLRAFWELKVKYKRQFL